MGKEYLRIKLGYVETTLEQVKDGALIYAPDTQVTGIVDGPAQDYRVYVIAEGDIGHALPKTDTVYAHTTMIRETEIGS